MTERRWVAVLALLSFALFTVYSLATPLFEASDELWHYPFVQRLATNGGLPIQRPGQTDADAPWRQEGSQPPLYYAFSAALSAPFDSNNWRELRRLNPHADMGVPTRDGNSNAILQTPADTFPWTRAALAVRAARLASIVLSTATVVFAWLAASEVFREVSPLRRLLVMVFVACVPMFAYISGAINNDNAAVVFSTAGLWWALRLIRLGRWDGRAAVIAGAVTGFAALSKVSGLGLAGLFAIAGVLSAWPTDGNLRNRLRGFARALPGLLRFGAILAVVAAAISAWWYIRNVVLYGGDILGWSAFLDAVGRREPPADLTKLWSEREGFFWAFWGVFGGLNVIMPVWTYDALLALTAAAGIGLALRLVRPHGGGQRASSPGDYGWKSRQALAIAAFTLIVFIGLLRWSALTPASQGRLMFPCIAAFGMAWVYGLESLQRRIPLIATAGLACLALIVPTWVLIPAYAKPALVWNERLSTPVGAVYAGAIELVEAGAETAAVPGAEISLRLNWRVLATPAVNYSVFVHLVDEDGVIVAQRDMHPGQGSLATAELPPGRLWSDRYTLKVSERERAPRNTHWEVGLYDAASGARAALAGVPGHDNAAAFGAVRITPRRDPPALLQYEPGIVLVRYSVSPSAIAPGEALQVDLDWSANRLVDGDFVASVQLLDARSGKAAQSDLPPAGRAT
ncbi:MAG: hypothetical protein ABIQ99_06720, partial [Thermoflexales bacterium]